jgi:hypothetical protein
VVFVLVCFALGTTSRAPDIEAVRPAREKKGGERRMVERRMEERRKEEREE